VALLGTPHGVEGREMETSVSPRAATTTEEADQVTGLEETLFRESLDLMQKTRLVLLASITKKLIMERALPPIFLVEI
jgi:hypothetical protein